jgi:hypothetical protein
VLLHGNQSWRACYHQLFKPVYAKQNSRALQPRALLVVFSVLVCILFSVAPFLRASSLEDAPHELAMKVCMAGRKYPVSVRWQESADSAGYWSDARKKAFLEQISACGMEPAESPDAPVLRVSVQVTPSSLLLIAESSEATEGRSIRMIEVPRDAPFKSDQASPGPHLKGELLWQQETPIDSALEWQDPASQERFLFLLGDGVLRRMNFQNAAWKTLDSTELPAVHRHSRWGDAGFAYAFTGRLFDFAIDGKICSFKPAGPISFSCAEESPQAKPLLLSSPCEPLPRYVMTGSGDYAQPDQILLGSPALDPTAKAPTAAPKEADSHGFQVPGPVLGISLAENASAAFAVVKNLATGNYEVYRIMADCSN